MIFNLMGEIPKYKQSWESMGTSILPMPVNQIIAAVGGAARVVSTEEKGSELKNKNSCGRMDIPCFPEWGVGVRWRETAGTECMVEVSLLALL